MKKIPQDYGRLLFDKVEEILSKEGLTGEERVPKYRIVLEELFQVLTEDEDKYFSNLHSRSHFIFETYKVPVPVRKHVDNLRKFANRIVHYNNIKVKPVDDARSLYQLSKTIAFFSGLEIPALVKNSYQQFDMQQMVEIEPPKPSLPAFDVRGIVRSVFIPDGDAHGMFCAAVCDTDEWGTITLKFWNNKNADGVGSDLTGIGPLLFADARIFVSEVKAYPDKQNEFFATAGSLVVLEPDYLVDAKDLSNAVQNKGSSPYPFLLNRFLSGNISDRVMIGFIAGYILDEITREQQFDYTSSFERAMRENSFGMLSIASQQGRYNRESIMTIFREGKHHQNAIQHVLEGLNDHHLSIEPTFISAKYGLQGRLDLLVQPKDSENKKDIIELKSGKFPPLNYFDGLYPNHKAQVFCYDFLLSSTYPQRTGFSSILYSRASVAERPLRHVPDEQFLTKQSLLMLRNAIVANEIKIAQRDFTPLLSLTPDLKDSFPIFQQGDLFEFHQTLENAGYIARNYFFEFVSFVYREMITAKVGGFSMADGRSGFASLWNASKSEKMESYEVLVYLTVADVSEDFQITLNIKSDLFAGSVSSFRGGEIAILYPTPDPEVLHPLHTQILKCYVQSVDQEKVVVSLINKQLDKSFFENYHYWAIEQDFRESNYVKMLQSLYQFLKVSDKVQQLVYGSLRPESGPIKPVASSHLNADQQEAVNRALAAKDYFLIQGPPGTGKTSKVVCEIIRLLAAAKEPSVVLAFTNRAVDEICSKLESLQIPFIKLGKGDSTNSWASLSRDLNLEALHAKVTETQIFVSTQATFSNSKDLLKIKSFKTLLVDEASQLLEPQLVGFLGDFERFILVGDQNQLPPVSLQSASASTCHQAELKRIGISSYANPLFERLIENAEKNKWPDCHVMLKTHYRMHEAIAAFPNREFYQGLLRTGAPEQQVPLEKPASKADILESAFRSSRLVFIPTSKDSRAKINEEEAILVAGLLKKAREIFGESFSEEKTIGVITPFRAQIANIKKHLGKGNFENTTIDTVERYQGSERDVILLSMAVKSSVQFKNIQSINGHGVDRKLNVALTRAKKHLIILGCEEVLLQNPTFRALIEHIRAHGGYLSAKQVLEKEPDFF